MQFVHSTRVEDCYPLHVCCSGDVEENIHTGWTLFRSYDLKGTGVVYDNAHDLCGTVISSPSDYWMRQ